MQTDPRWFLKPDNLKVFVILYHGHEPNELLDREYWTDEVRANRRAEKIRKQKGCLAGAVEVAELKFVCE